MPVKRHRLLSCGELIRPGMRTAANTKILHDHFLQDGLVTISLLNTWLTKNHIYILMDVTSTFSSMKVCQRTIATPGTIHSQSKILTNPLLLIHQNNGHIFFAKRNGHGFSVHNMEKIQ